MFLLWVITREFGLGRRWVLGRTANKALLDTPGRFFEDDIGYDVLLEMMLEGLSALEKQYSRASITVDK